MPGGRRSPVDQALRELAGVYRHLGADRQAGVSTRVFEARDRVGGRCWSDRNFEGDQVGEHGGEFVDTRHVHVSLLADELGLTLDDLWSAWVPGSTWLEFVEGEIVKGRELLVDMHPAIQSLVKFSSTHGGASHLARVQL